MELIKYIFSGLVGLVLAQVKNHKTEIEDLISGFIKSYIDRMLDAGHEDSVKKLQSLVAEHTES